MLQQRYRTLHDFFEQTGATQAWLAEKVGVRQSFISMLRSGERHADVPLAKRIAAITGVPFHTLLRPEVAEALR